MWWWWPITTTVNVPNGATGCINSFSLTTKQEFDWLAFFSFLLLATFDVPTPCDDHHWWYIRHSTLFHQHKHCSTPKVSILLLEHLEICCLSFCTNDIFRDQRLFQEVCPNLDPEKFHPCLIFVRRNSLRLICQTLLSST